MLGHFPDPLPDELLFSICTRYADHAVTLSRQSVYFELFGQRRLYHHIELPSQVGMLVEKLPPGHAYSVDQLIDDHTFYPYYAPFAEPDTAVKVRHQMTLGVRQSVRISTHTSMPGSSRVKHAPWLRYCPHCVAQDRHDFGECYWHRVHQAPGVLICARHATWLENSQVPRSVGYYSFVSAEQAGLCTDARLARDSEYFVPMHDLAMAIEELLHCSPAHGCFGRVFVQSQLRALLRQRGYISKRNQICTHQLVPAFISHYPRELLGLLGCDWDDAKLSNSHNECWVNAVARPQGRYHHALYVLLMCRFLGVSVTELFSQRFADEHPLSVGPWPCYNPVCSRYGIASPAVQRTSLRSTKERLWAQFKCECGFAYSRSVTIGLDPTLRVQPCHVVSRGPLWEETFRDLWQDPAVSIKEIAIRLNVSDVCQVAGRLRLPSRPGGASPTLRAAKRPRQRRDGDEVRARWSAVRAMYPDASRTELHQLCLAEHTWLFRNDHQWLKEHQPPKKPLVRPRVEQRLSKRWTGENDRALAEKVVAVSAQLRTLPGRPKRVTLKLLYAHVPELRSACRKLTSLPHTAAALETSIESYEQCAVRRIAFVVAKYTQLGSCLKTSELTFLADVNRPSFQQSALIQSALQETMAAFNC